MVIVSQMSALFQGIAQPGVSVRRLGAHRCELQEPLRPILVWRNQTAWARIFASPARFDRNLGRSSKVAVILLLVQQASFKNALAARLFIPGTAGAQEGRPYASRTGPCRGAGCAVASRPGAPLGQRSRPCGAALAAARLFISGTAGAHKGRPYACRVTPGPGRLSLAVQRLINLENLEDHAHIQMRLRQPDDLQE